MEMFQRNDKPERWRLACEFLILQHADEPSALLSTKAQDATQLLEFAQDS